MSKKPKRKLEDMEVGRSPRATNLSNFKQVVSEYLPRSGLERAPRVSPRQNAEVDAGSNHNDLIRGNGY